MFEKEVDICKLYNLIYRSCPTEPHYFRSPIDEYRSCKNVITSEIAVVLFNFIKTLTNNKDVTYSFQIVPSKGKGINHYVFTIPYDREHTVLIIKHVYNTEGQETDSYVKPCNDITYMFHPIDKYGKLIHQFRNEDAPTQLTFENYDGYCENFVYQETELTKKYTHLILKDYLSKILGNFISQCTI